MEREQARSQIPRKRQVFAGPRGGDERSGNETSRHREITRMRPGVVVAGPEAGGGPGRSHHRQAFDRGVVAWKNPSMAWSPLP